MVFTYVDMPSNDFGHMCDVTYGLVPSSYLVHTYLKDIHFFNMYYTRSTLANQFLLYPINTTLQSPNVTVLSSQFFYGDDPAFCV